MGSGAGARAGPAVYGALRRVLLIALGFLAILLGLGPLVAIAVLFVREVMGGWRPGKDLPQLALVVACALLVFGGLAALGLDRIAEGFRGRPRERFRLAVRAEAWYARRWYVANLVFFAALTGAGLLAARDFAALLRGPALVSGWALLALLLLPLHVAFHELGHALAGAAVGMRFAGLRIGWLLVRRDGGHLRLSWSPQAVAGALGFHSGLLALPPGGSPRIAARRLRLALHALAGPASSLLLGAACRAGYAAIGDATSVGIAVMSHTLLVSSWVGFYLGVLNLIPFRLRSGFASDGAQLLAQLSSRAPPDVVLRFQDSWARGLRPREWGTSAEAFLRAIEEAPRHLDTLVLAALAVALDTADHDLANDILRGPAERSGSCDRSMRYEIELQIAMFEASRGNAAAARARLGRLVPHPTLSEYQLLAEAFVLHAEGHPSEARAALGAWERAVARSGNAASVRVGNEWAEEQLRARLGS
jgi:hypothetical protein